MPLSFQRRPVSSRSARASALNELLHVIPLLPPGLTYPPDTHLDTLLEYLHAALPAEGDASINGNGNGNGSSDNKGRELQTSVYTLKPCTGKRCWSMTQVSGSCKHQEPLHSRIPRPLVEVEVEEGQVGVVVWSWSSTDDVAAAAGGDGDTDLADAVPISPEVGASAQDAEDEWYAARLMFRGSNCSPGLVSHARLETDVVTGLGLGLQGRKSPNERETEKEKEKEKGVKRSLQDVYEEEDGGDGEPCCRGGRDDTLSGTSRVEPTAASSLPPPSASPARRVRRDKYMAAPGPLTARTPTSDLTPAPGPTSTRALPPPKVDGPVPAQEPTEQEGSKTEKKDVPEDGAGAALARASARDVSGESLDTTTTTTTTDESILAQLATLGARLGPHLAGLREELVRARISLATLQASFESADELLRAERATNAGLRVRVRDLERERDEAVEAHRESRRGVRCGGV